MKILLAEDHMIVNKGLKTLLDDAFDDAQIIYAKDSQSALYQLASKSPIDLLITDLELDEGDWALDMVQLVKKMHPSLPVIVYSKFEEKSKLNDCLRVGADAYVSKKDDEQYLVTCIKNVLNHGRTVSFSEEKINQKAEMIFDQSFMTADEKFQKLSEREKEVAHLIYQDSSRKELAQRLFIGEETVKTHTRHIYEKLGVDSKAKLQVFFDFNPHLLPDE